MRYGEKEEAPAAVPPRPFRDSILVALLVALAFPPFGLWPLAWIAFVYLARDLLTAPAKELGQRLAVYAYAVNLFGFYWISYTFNEFGGMGWPLALLAMILMFALCSVAPWALGWLWGQARERTPDFARGAALALFLVLWDGLEPRFFPWTPAMSVGSDALLLASTYHLGTWGWRALFFTSAALCAWATLRPKNARARLAPALALPIALLVGYVAGYHARKTLRARYAGRQPVALVQGNVGNNEKKLTKLQIMPTVQNVLAIHRDLIESAAVRFAESTERTSTEPWIFWPETSFPGFPTNPNSDRRLMEDWTRLTRGLQIVGAYEQGPVTFGGQTATLDFNVVALFHEREGFVKRYRKVIRVPFGEYIPGDEKFPNAYKYLPAVNHFGMGTDRTGLPHPDPQGPVFVPLVCYEILFESFVNDFVRQARAAFPGRPLILLNPTNDSWYGPTSEPFQNSFLARWAAARHGLALLRPTNTGISIVVAPWGEVLARGPRDEAALIYGELPVERVQKRLSSKP